MNKIFFRTEKGHLGQYEDWWSFDEESGLVTHSWDHVRVNGLAQNQGSETFSSTDFLSGNHHAGAKSELKKLLGVE
ncbi:hypothetical protein KUV61_04225 [Nocardioides marinus]|nr:hypothetical protein [Nocardioides marinus]